MKEEINESMRHAEEATVTEPLSDASIPEDAPQDAVQETERAVSDTEESDASSEEIDYARLAEEDLAEIKRLDPSYAPATHLGELPFARRFAELRDLGLSVKEALAAAAPRFEKYDGRTHLRAVTPRGTRVPEGTLDRERMKEAKSLFAGLSESEINALYRRVSNRNDD